MPSQHHLVVFKMPIQQDNGIHASFADVGLRVPEKDEPPPNYTESYRPIPERNDDSAPEYKQIPSRLISLFYSIMKLPDKAMPLLKGDFRAALLREPPANHSFIADIARIISDTCEGVRNGSSCGINNQQPFQSTEDITNGEQMETTSARFYVQHDQDTGVENRSARTEPSTPINTITRPNAPSSPASENSELSLLATPSIPSPFKDALTEDVPEQEKNIFAHQMLHQSIGDFTQEARLIIKRFSSPREPDATHLTLISYLQYAGVNNEKTGTDGSEWLSLVEAGHKDHQLGTIKYAIATMAFTRWHESRVNLQVEQLQPTDVSRKKTSRKRKRSTEEEPREAAQKKASHLVTITLIGEKPGEDTERSAWEQRRKNVGTYLARGRKWHRLV